MILKTAESNFRFRCYRTPMPMTWRGFTCGLAMRLAISGASHRAQAFRPIRRLDQDQGIAWDTT